MKKLSASNIKRLAGSSIGTKLALLAAIFTAHAQAQPVISNLDITPRLVSASVSLDLDDPGTGTPVAIHLFCHDNDPETDDFAAWQAAPLATDSIDNPAPGPQAFALGGLTNNATYHLRAFVTSPDGTNSLGAAFTTPNHSTWTAGGGADTDWLEPANWDNGVPFDGVTANFDALNGNAGPPTIVTATGDLMVGNALVNAAGEVVFDVGPHTLFATGGYAMADRNMDLQPRTLACGFAVGGQPFAGRPAPGNARAVIMSGTVNVGANVIIVGDGQKNATANAGGNSLVVTNNAGIAAKILYAGMDAASSGQRNSVSVLGPGARFLVDDIKVGTYNSARDNSLLLRGVFATNANIVVADYAACHRNTITIEDSVYQLTGRFFMGKDYAHSENRLNILNSNVRFEGSGDTFYFGRSTSTTEYTGVVSNSFFYVKGEFGVAGNTSLFRIIGNDGNPANETTCGGSFAFYGTKNRLVVERGTLRAPGMFYFAWNTSYNRLISSNGVIRANVVTFHEAPSNFHRVVLAGLDAELRCGWGFCLTHPNDPKNPAYFKSEGNGLTMQGGRAYIPNFHVAGKPDGAGCGVRFETATDYLEAQTFETFPGSLFEYDIPAEGYFGTNAVNSAPFVAIKTAELDPATRFRITANGFTGRQTLLEAPKGILYKGGKLPAENFVFDLPRNYVGQICQNDTNIEVKITPTPTLFMIR